MAELADALDLGSSGSYRAGSSPTIRIKGDSDRTMIRVPLFSLKPVKRKTEPGDPIPFQRGKYMKNDIRIAS